MTTRVTHFVVAAALTLAVPGAAQRAGTVEAGAFARYTRFDNSLGVGNAIGAGGRLAVFLQPNVTVELDLARTSSDRPGGAAVTHSPLHARLTYYYQTPGSARVDVLVGAGLVRNRYSGAYSATDHGLAVLVGVRYHWNDRIGARLDANEDFVTSPANETPQVTYNSNFAVHVGVSVLLDWRRSAARR